MPAWWSQVAADPTRSLVVAAWFTTLGALSAAIVSAMVSYLVARRSVYINAVRVERSKWIEALRLNIAKFSGAAAKVIALRKRSAYEGSTEWAADSESLQALLSELTLRLNPNELVASNFLEAAKKVNAAARLHSGFALLLANEIMIRHAQWLLKAEWDRVKQEASGWIAAPLYWWRNWRRRRRYSDFLRDDGRMSRLKLIGAGKGDAELIFARSSMDTQNGISVNAVTL